MTRIFFFLISYGLIVITVTNMIFYLNYVTLGHGWKQVMLFIISTTDFLIFIVATIILILTVYVRAPSPPPSY
ncbi:hypothetical protein NCCP2222_38430 [Sporosarcina sp. NCCP-2222]|nr:hypothetical protein NCCP2222_38430 [Sporosarcina sp. NCCP-2222]